MSTPNSTSSSLDQRKRNAFRFLVGFGLFMIGFYLFYVTAFFQNYLLLPLTTLYAMVSSVILNLLGFNTVAKADMLFNDAFSISIKAGCDAIQPIALYSAAVLTLPALFSQKIRGLLVGIPFLITVNLLRIISLFLIGIYMPSLFDFMHFEAWQVAFILIALSTLIYWIYWVSKQHKTDGSDL